MKHMRYEKGDACVVVCVVCVVCVCVCVCVCVVLVVLCNVSSLKSAFCKDLPPVRREGDVSAYLSIMRGCEQYCAYCVVPFTRGKERSRTIESVVTQFI